MIIYKLKNNLRIPVSEIEELGTILFDKKHFGVYHDAIVNNLLSTLVVEVCIIRLSDNKIVKRLKTLSFSEDGENGVMVNEKKYNAYISQLETLQGEVKSTQEAIDIETEKAAADRDAEMIDNLFENRKSKETELKELVKIEPEYEKINKFSQLKKHLTIDGLSADGLKWAMKRAGLKLPLVLTEEKESGGGEAPTRKSKK